ncbi:hypothetical protein RB653_007289 [Dictyostelium firmibasis]|uniref:Uncharacterized protein n=1 Tax=Dictyostelium firmibasis TaxID=79012 RepID=A0AAN7TV54_9MYCE
MIKSIILNSNKTLKVLNKSTLFSSTSNKNSNIINNKYYCKFNTFNFNNFTTNNNNNNINNSDNNSNNNNNNNGLGFNYSTKSSPTSTTTTTTTTATPIKNSKFLSSNISHNNKTKVVFDIDKNGEDYKIENILKGIEEHPDLPFYYYFLYGRLLEMNESSIKLLDGKEIDLKYLLVKSIENQEKQPNADFKFISYNYYELGNLLKGFQKETIVINGKSLNKLDLILLSLDRDSTNRLALEMIQNYMISFGVRTVSLLNGGGEIYFKKNQNNNPKIFTPKKKPNPVKNKLIKIIEKNENKYVVEDSLFKLVSSMGNSEKVELLGGLVDKLDIAKRLLQTHGVICNKLSNAYLIVYLILNDCNIESIESMDGINITQKQLLISHIERTPNNLQSPQLDTNYFSYYLLSTLLNGFTDDFVVIQGKSYNKLDLILKAYDINEASESCKRHLEIYLYCYGVDSLTLLNNKKVSLNQNNELQFL